MALPNLKRPFAAKTISDDFADHVKRGSVNPGTDYAVAYGSDVAAVANGVVEIVKRTTSGAAGRYIVLRHSGGWRTEYLHLSGVRVKPGQQVKQGQIIGDVGGSGFGKDRHYGTHLHLTLSSGNTPLSRKGNIDFEKALQEQQAKVSAATSS